MTLLTVAQFREHVTTSLGDDAVQRLLDDAEDTIVTFAGAVASAEEVVNGAGGRISVSRPISSISSVVERDGWASPITLAADDYEVLGAFNLIRLRYGTNGYSTWRAPVRVAYVPVDDTDTRKIVQIELVRLAISTNPGLASETVGAWTQTYSSIGAKSIPDQRADILSRLRYSAGMVVV